MFAIIEDMFWPVYGCGIELDDEGFFDDDSFSADWAEFEASLGAGVDVGARSARRGVGRNST